jgi:hypothetical protein
MGLLWLA